eukprot:CFRG3037T1
MGKRHGRNNTALPFNTNYEKEQMGYGTKKRRLGRNSFRDFDACYLCLNMAINPLCCGQGHIACKECIYSNLLSQKEEYSRQLLAHKQQKEELELKEESKAEKEVENNLRKFEDAQTSLLPQSSTRNAKSKTARDDGKRIYDVSKKNIWPDKPDVSFENTSRDGSSAALDSSDTAQVPEAGTIKADLKALPAFWIPGLTPDAAATLIKKPTIGTFCTADKPFHPLKLKHLFPVRFTSTVKGTTEAQSLKKDRNDRWQCPSCAKTLANNPRIHVVRKCGHVICNRCKTEYITMDHVCSVCSGPAPEKDIIPVSIEGTGFASGGGQLMATTYNHVMG